MFFDSSYLYCGANKYNAGTTHAHGKTTQGEYNLSGKDLLNINAGKQMIYSLPLHDAEA